MEITPDSFTVDYILARKQALEQAHNGRNARMGLYEKMYTLDVWPEQAAEDEHRVTLPIAYDTVEKTRALLVTRPPVISVPYPSSEPQRQADAQKKESFLYGALSLANFMQSLADAEWFADCLGHGDLKCTYDADAFVDEPAIIIMAPEPRTVYGLKSPRKDRYVELVHTWERSRREIEAETGKDLPRPMDLDMEREAEWLDESTSYVEYWAEVASWETRKAEKPQQEPPTSTMRAADIFVTAMENSPELAPGAPSPVPISPEGRTPPRREPSGEATPPPAEPGEEEPTESKRVRVRKILHAILVEDASDPNEKAVWIKKPIYVPGYKYVPFFGWSGISTPLAGKNADLSVLFGLSNGDCIDGQGGAKAMGLLAAMNWLVSLNLQQAVNTANTAFVSDDPEAEIDTRSGAVNRVKPGTKIVPLNSGSVNPGSMGMTDALNQQISRVGIPQIWDGTPQSLSGQALSGFATAYQMILGQKQHNREVALSAMCTHILAIAKEYAVDGWRVWGYNAANKYVQETITSEDIGDDLRVSVKLSASMPKDDLGTISMMSTLQKANQISQETFLDVFQKLFGLAAETPDDERKRIARDMVMSSGEIAKALATYFATDYVAMLTGQKGGISQEEMARAVMAKLQAELQPPAPPQGPPQAPPGVLPGGPPQGPPPGAAPMTPEMVMGGGNIAGGQAMMGNPMSGSAGALGGPMPGAGQ